MVLSSTGREYDRRLISDIEVGLKSWDTLKNCIDPTCWHFAKEIVSQTFPGPQISKSPNKGPKLCTTWNKFRKQGCQYEHNSGLKCNFLHQCSLCSGDHKALYCTFETDLPSDFSSVSEPPEPENAYHL